MKIRQAVKKAFDDFERIPEKQSGFLGRADGTVRVPGKRHWLYVRLWNGNVVEAYNQNVPANFGLAVDVVYRNGQYFAQARQVYQDVVNTSVPDGLEDELQWPNSRTMYVRPEQFLAGLVYPKSGMTVYVYGGMVPLPGGGYIEVPSSELDLTPYLPASGAIWAVVSLDEDGSIGVTTGGAADNWQLLDKAEIPFVTDGYPLFAIRLFKGQTSLQHGKFGSVFEDLRWIRLGGSGGGTWGSITGTLSDQEDLQDALDGKLDADTEHNDLGGLQGGTTDEYYHLTSAQASAVANLDSTYQPLDVELSAIAGLSSAANKLPYFTGSGTAALTDLSAAARTVLDDATTAAMLTTLGAQPLDAELSAIAGLSSAANKLPYFTGAGTAALTDLSAAARTVLDDATTAAMLATMGGAPLASPALTGNPTAPTPSTEDNDTSIATTAFVQAVKNADRRLLSFASYNSLGSPISSSPLYPYAATLPSFTIYPKQWSQGLFVGATNNASNYWLIELITNISGSDMTIASINTSALSPGASLLTTTSFSPTSLTQASNIRLVVKFSKVGSPSNISAHGPVLEYTLTA